MSKSKEDQQRPAQLKIQLIGRSGPPPDNRIETFMITDVLDRVTRTTLPDGSPTAQSYSLQEVEGSGGSLEVRAVTHVTDAEGRQRTALRDGRGQVRTVIEHLRDSLESLDGDLLASLDGDTLSERTAPARAPTYRQVHTSYRYDPLGQIRAIADAGGNRTDVAYDYAGRRTAITHPDSGTTHLAYDLAGNLIARQTANLQKNEAIEYRYDYNQLTAIHYPNYPELDVHYTYGKPNETEGHRAGRIKRVQDGVGTEERWYGPLGELVEQHRTTRRGRSC